MDLSPEEDNFPGRLFHQAALWDNAELLADLVSGATDDEENLIDATDGLGRTALHAAATCENSRCMLILLQAGADPNKASDPRAKCKTPLHVSSERGDLKNVKTLLDGGANWNVRDIAGNTPLLLAELSGHSTVAKLLKDIQDENERARAARHAELRTALAAGLSLRDTLSTLGTDAGLIVNMAPAGANTLLFTAAEMGLIDAVKALVAAGADGRSHPVTRYSPLYVACYHGNKNIAEILLLNFPEMVQQQTVERWLPLHASCINGHAELVSLLLDFPYPEKLLTTYRNPTGEWEYQAVFDINHRDVSGQTALYVACLLGNRPIVDILLRYTVKAVKVASQTTDVLDEASTPNSIKSIEHEIVVSPTRRRISDGIQSILSKLSMGSKQQDSINESNSDLRIRPVNLDAVIGFTRDTCLRAAVRGRHSDIAQTLLTAGADPNAPSNIQHSNTRTSIGSNLSQCSVYSTASQNSTINNSSANCANPFANIQESISLPALVEACKARDHSLVEILLKHGAKDLTCLALKEAANLNDETLISRLLAIKAYPDPEYKINKRGMTDSMSINGLLSPGSDPMTQTDNVSLNRRAPLLTYSAMFPSQPAMLNWHNQSCRLTSIKMSWIQDAALYVNPKLLSSSRGRSVALHAVTRLDLSGNALNSIPLAVLQMTSLRYLNVAQNKLEKLPVTADGEENCEQPTRGRRSRRSGSQQNGTEDYFTAPVLEEIYLQENRLEYLPDALFSLPALTTLDVSNNKLKKLPYSLWRSPRLRDLNASLNLLRDLPTKAEHVLVAEEAANTLVTPSMSSQNVRIPSSNSSGHLSSSSNSFSNANSSTNLKIQRRSWSVDRVAGIKSDTSRDSFSETSILDEETLTYNKKVEGVLQQELRKHHLWTRGLEIAERPPEPPPTARCSRLTIFNLAHNQFTSIPAGLPCLAPSLSRLNMSYNGLRSMSHVTSYPNSLKQLDLSHNKITCWPSLPQVDSWGPLEQGNLLCYCSGSNAQPRTRARSASGVRKAVLAALCPARRHLRLDGLRTLVLADNLLTRIQLTTDDDGGGLLEYNDKTSTGEKIGRDGNTSTDDDDDWNLIPVVRTRLLFPNLSMLDVSNNMLKCVPSAIHELSNLSVLNISGNSEIAELPSQMGLLNRLWNLNTFGCPLQEPLRSMIDSKKYKTMDIIGYLKSVLEDAKPYARMKLMVVGIQGIGKTSLLDRLRQESAPAHRRRPPEHWAKRMGNKNINTKTSRGTNISTVGVDIGDWIYDRHPARSGRSAHGPVIFRTWDFGGQKEYYSTHQYFLSRRSLYIVVWRVPDGINGLAGIQHWLVSIQARAPNSPVIIVGTHYDAIADMPPEQAPEQLQRIIRERFISISDPEKRGFPRVLDSVEVSCSTRHNIRLLSNLIYDTVFSLRQPGSKELLLEQRIPASYLALEDAVGVLAAERRARGLDPVLTHEHFKHQVAQYMQQKFHRGFRDQAELHQATMFLHDNGVLLHYDDATLKDLYFLDPQWLCDMLAHVVTVREINPFARLGLMRLEDLQLLFKSTRAGDSREYVVSLLNKFEVALSWDGRSLLLPPLLPAAEPPPDGMGINNCVKIPMKTRGWTGRGHKKIAVSPLSILNQNADGLVPSGSIVATNVPCGPAMSSCSAYNRSYPQRTIRRLLIASYSPCGFWPRLITRLLADDTISDIVDAFYPVPEEFANDSAIMKAANQGSEWWPWQSGLRLTRSNVPLLSLREVPQEYSLYRNIRFRLKQEGMWTDVDTISSSILEILLPADEMIIKRPITDEQGDAIGFQNICIEPSIEAMSKLLVLVVDHIDILLEDWYPTLGTRFVHTSEGRFLVTRLVPCPQCLIDAETIINNGAEEKSNDVGDKLNNIHPQLQEAFQRAPREDIAVVPSRASQESTTSDGDSGVGPDSSGSSRMPSMEGVVGSGQGSQFPAVHAWMIEECILQAGSSRSIDCPIHHDTMLAKIAPDVIFLDLGPRRLASNTDLTRGALIGRGAFGLVFRAEWRGRGPVALKVLQPVPPGPRAPASAQAAYKAAAARWDRDPAQAACRAYLSARSEMGVLLPLRHPNVAPFLAACTSPLALVLALAPMGALDGVLRGYRQSGARLGPHCAQAVAIQAARALEYLHRQRVIYRDLKAENVLVWEMPPPVGPFKDHPDLNVHIKVADYGISRLTLPSGTKGFGGTEGFMAPEIMRYNGEEEYTEKVDCFSFGMFLYELLTLRQPFEGHEAVKECVLEGGRPALTHKETLYPCYMLDLMVACWSGQPEQRPSASQIVSIASAPEFTHLADVVSLHQTSNVTNATATQVTNITDEGANGWEVWISRSRPRCDVLAAAHARWIHYHALPVPTMPQDVSTDEMILPTAMCSVNCTIWIGDSVGHIHAYDSSDCHHVFSYALETNNCEVSALLHLPTLGRVAAALSNGRLFLLDSNAAPLSPTAGEGTFVMTELGAASTLHCLAAVSTDEYCELWCGGDTGGGVSIYRLVTGIGAAGAQELACPVPPVSTNSRVLHAVAGVNTVYTYLYPGCVIYQWDAFEKCLLARLDCSKLVPCSESLRSIAIEEHLSPGRCQVTSLAVLNDDVYIGTTWGCIIIAEKETLRPVTIFRPYEEEVRAIIPLPPYKNNAHDNGDTQSNDAWQDDDTPLIATIGRGYRSLLARYTDTPNQCSTNTSTSQGSSVIHCLLWRAEHWAAN